MIKTSFDDPRSRFITPSEVQKGLNSGVDSLLGDASGAKELGRTMAGSPTPGQKSSLPEGTKAFASSVGQAVGNAMPDAEGLDTMPKLLLGANRALGKLGADFMGTLPAQVGTAAGQQFEGSPAARGAANTLAPMVNKSFGNLWDQSTFGKITKWIQDPGSLIDQKAKELGISKPGTQGAK
jgi:hypothetical protein